MPVIKVWCLPKQSEEELNRLFEAIVKAVEGISELKLKGERSMTVLFPTDAMAYGLGTEIIIEVMGLFEKPERTDEVRNRLARSLGIAVRKLFPLARVQCFVYSFNPSQGFWKGKK